MFYSTAYSLNSSLPFTVSNPTTLVLTIITLLHIFSKLLTGNHTSSGLNFNYALQINPPKTLLYFHSYAQKPSIALQLAESKF